MNRTYRVVYNQSTGTYVAVAEFAKSHSKSNSKKALVTTLVTAVGLLGLSAPLYAAVTLDGGVNNGDSRSIVIGGGAEVGKGTGQSIAIGNSAVTTGGQATGLGNNVKASGNSSVAIGGDDIDKVVDSSSDKYFQLTGGKIYKGSDTANGGKYISTESGGAASVALGVQTLSKGDFSTAIGMTANSYGDGAVAIGARAMAELQGATAIGTASQAAAKQAVAIGVNSTALGMNATALGSGGTSRATATQATKEGSVAIGGDSVAGAKSTGKNAIAIGGQSVASVDNAVAIGAGSKSTHGNSVALGVNSVADGANIGNAAYRPLDANGNPVAVAGMATGEVSIGKAGSERRITNMAAGSADTDGVNVSQLKAVNSALTSKMDVLGNNITTLGGKVTTMQTSISTLEQGWKLQSDGDAASAVKAGNTVAINSGSNIDVSRTGNTITVATAKDMTLNSVSFSDTAGNNSVLSASGLNVSNSKTGNSVSYGSDALTFTKDGNTANAVSVGSNGISAGNQTISNVGNGALTATSRDAVNGSQLYQTNQVLNQTNQQVNQNTADIANLSQGWKLQSDGDAASSVLAGDTVQINSGKNIDVSPNGNTLTIATADDLNLNSVTLQDASGNNSVLTGSGLNVSNASGNSSQYGADSLVFNPNTANAVSIGNAGINAGNQKITNVADGTLAANYQDAVNGSQLYQTNQNVTDLDNKVADLSQGWNLQSDGDNASAVHAGDTVAINSGKNIDVSRVGNDITINTSDDLVVNSVVADDGAGNTMTLNASGLTLQDALGNANLQTATNNTLISNNFSNVTTALGSNLSDGQNTAQYLVGGAVLNNANGDTTVITGAGMSAFDQNGDHTDYGSNGLVINNAGNTITISNGDINFGGNTLSNVAAGVTAGDAVNKSQLDQVGNSTANALGGSSSYDAATGTVNAGLAVGGTTFTTVQAALDAVNQQANAGWKVSTEKGTTYTVAPNATVDFSNNDDNVVIKNGIVA